MCWFDLRGDHGETSFTCPSLLHIVCEAVIHGAHATMCLQFSFRRDTPTQPAEMDRYMYYNFGSLGSPVVLPTTRGETKAHHPQDA